jgi:hypothetical protein
VRADITQKRAPVAVAAITLLLLAAVAACGSSKAAVSAAAKQDAAGPRPRGVSPFLLTRRRHTSTFDMSE